MPIKKRNLLCLKRKENLDIGHIILYEPYKNILSNFYELSTNPRAIDFDPVSRIFDGLESVSNEFKYYYEALLGITSYYIVREEKENILKNASLHWLNHAQ